MQTRPPLRLLLIEDNKDLSTLLQFVLETVSGWQVMLAKSTEDWFALVQAKDPDVILWDGHPYDSERLLQLKANLLTRNIPVVCLVARDRAADQIQAKQAGVAAIIAKPFDPLELVDAIEDLVQSPPI